MTSPERLHHIWSTLAAPLSQFGPVYIAGGAVRDTLMGREPKDYDVFVLGLNDTEVNEQGVLAELTNYVNVEVRYEHKSEPFLIKTTRIEGCEVQIMINPAPTIDQLISTFDWNTCLFAFGAEGYVCKESIENIGPGKELRLNACHYPWSTLRRGYRFSERFGMKLSHETIQRVLDVIASRRLALADLIVQI